jgi:hypothetical protein
MLEWQSVASSADGNRLVAVTSGGGIYVRESTPTPILSIGRFGGNLLLSWLVPSMNFALQQNPDLNPTNWTDVTITPTLNMTNLEYQVTMPAPADTMFYRLKSP